MARGINKVILIGNVGGDPEVRYMPNGSAVTTITLATSETWKDKQTGQSQERVEWHRVVFFNRLGEVAGEYLRKGAKIYVEGSLRTNKWQDQEGKDRYRTEIVGSEMQMLDSRNTNNNETAQQGGYQQQAPQHSNQQNRGGQQNAPANQSKQRSPHQNTPNAGDFNNNQSSYQQNQQGTAPNFDDFDDDIPFANPYKNMEHLV